MNKKQMISLMVLVVIVVGVIFFATRLSAAKTTGNAILDPNGPVIKDGYQEMNMDVGYSGYSPNSFVLKKGVPVRWNVNVKELTGCNQRIIAKEYNIDETLSSGLNTIEFTPTETGNFQFTCGMGMLRGSFIVTESGTATTQQVKSATPATGMQCGGSTGGGCGCGRAV